MEYGNIYILNNNIEGKWIKNILLLLNKLYCNFINLSEDYQNGIKVNNNNEGENISNKICIFLLNCYLMQYKEQFNEDGYIIGYYTPINIILDEINTYKYLNNFCIYNYLDGINTILNHPHFKECKTVLDIEYKINLIPNLNNRFNQFIY